MAPFGNLWQFIAWWKTRTSVETGGNGGTDAQGTVHCSLKLSRRGVVWRYPALVGNTVSGSCSIVSRGNLRFTRFTKGGARET